MWRSSCHPGAESDKPSTPLGCGDAADRRGPSARRRSADAAARQADRAGGVPIAHAAAGRDPGGRSHPGPPRRARRGRDAAGAVHRFGARRRPGGHPRPPRRPRLAGRRHRPLSRTPWSATLGWSATRRRTSRATTTRSSRRSAGGTRCCSTRCSPRVGPAPPRPRTCKAAQPLGLTFVCVVAAPEGVARMEADHPDVPIVAGALDRKLNAHAYIVPGLGDFGDRLYGTECTRRVRDGQSSTSSDRRAALVGPAGRGRRTDLPDEARDGDDRHHVRDHVDELRRQQVDDRRVVQAQRDRLREPEQPREEHQPLRVPVRQDQCGERDEPQAERLTLVPVPDDLGRQERPGEAGERSRKQHALRSGRPRPARRANARPRGSHRTNAGGVPNRVRYRAYDTGNTIRMATKTMGDKSWNARPSPHGSEDSNGTSIGFRWGPPGSDCVA